jgi:prepilin-type N-terminal cleavage/methylation domain-containing protein/prepilin-type processing-associated H-X9-DG protein
MADRPRSNREKGGAVISDGLPSRGFKSGLRTPDNTGPTRSAFTLLELLVVMAIIALLLGVLLPALASSRSEGTKVKCIANLRSLGQALASYSTDDENGFAAPVHPSAGRRWYDGDYDYGGKTGIGPYGVPDFATQNRPLNRYLFRSSKNSGLEFFQCPTETGIPSAPFNFDEYFFNDVAIDKPAHQVTGTSYRLNNHIDFTGRFPQYHDHFYGPYMRPSSQVPDAGATVILEETVTEVAKWNEPIHQTMGWHRKPNRFNVSFVDGHASSIYLAGQNEQSAYDGEVYWILRGDGWRMDCWPRPPICDSPKSCD